MYQSDGGPLPSVVPTPSGTPGGTSGGTSGGTALTADQQSAKGIIDAALTEWGLQGLGAQAWQWYLTGLPVDTIMQNIRQTDTYKQRFPGMADLQKSGQAISEADYIAKERADIEMMRAYGLPDQMINRQELGALIGNQVSTAELQTRLNSYQQTVQQLPQEVRDYLQRQEGVTPGDLLGFWLNPDVAAPIIDQKARAAAIGGAAAISGFGDLDASTAQRLAGMQSTLYGDFRNTLTEFQKAQQLSGLTQALPDQQAALSRDDLVNATVGGDQNAVTKVQQAVDASKAKFAGGGDYLTGSKGAAGLGPNLA